MIHPLTSASNDKPGTGGRFEMHLSDDGIIDVRVWGFWRTAELNTFFDPFRSLHAAARARSPQIRQLVRLESLQSPGLAAEARALAVAMKRPGDRTAIVVATILAKLQIKRLSGDHGFGVFTDPVVARAWLLSP